jgi:outer membrane protein OmpA-like peptidoglycan-associated protein
MNGRIVALVVAVVLLPRGAAAAEHPSAEDIATKLDGAARSWGSDRGITSAKAGPDGVAAIDLTITFEFNSAALTADGAVLVGNLGRALKDPRLSGKRFRIEGHTDAVGGDAFNQRLSEQRAETVRRQLTNGHTITVSRLEVVGYGESRLLDSSQPTSGVNRRVRVVNLGDGE